MRDNEQHISLAAAAKLSPGRPSACAVWRWCRKGIKSRPGRRIHLEHIRAGGKIFTTVEALDRFFEAVAAADAEHFEGCRDGGAPRAPVHKQQRRLREVARAEQELNAAGI